MARRQRLIGVDFSGARDAGQRAWVADGRLDADGRYALEACLPVMELPDGGSDRASAHAALVAFLAGARDATAGLDFPFSLPESLIPESTWANLLRGFALRYPDPESFREDCRRQAGGRELKRRTDVEAKVPFCVYNLRLYRQTHAGMAAVLLPLLEADAARFVPMDRPAKGKITIAEICPASTLKAAGLYASYKGRGPVLREARARLFEAMVERGRLARPPAALRERIVEDRGGDALDSVLAAIGAAGLPARLPTPDRLDRIEGRVYF